MPPIDGTITFLKVADLATSTHFYGEMLGLELVLDQGGCHIYRLTEDSFLGVCKRDGAVDSNVIVTVVTDDVDAWYQKISGSGIQTDGPPRDNDEYLIYHFFIEDPDGHSIEFQRFWDDAWSSSQVTP